MESKEAVNTDLNTDRYNTLEQRIVELEKRLSIFSTLEPPPLLVNPSKTFKQRLLIGTPMTGLLRSEWYHARTSQIIPTNWSQVEILESMYAHVPLRFQVADAENLIAKYCIDKEFEWLLFIEHDNILPPYALVKINEWMIKGDVPIVSGLYFTKSDPPEPLVYSEFAWGHIRDFKLGDLVWAKGVPFGFTLIHGSIIKALWDESPEYVIETSSGKVVTRRVFIANQEEWFDVQLGIKKIVMGTSDLAFCERVMKNKIFEKAGWPKYEGMDRPFLVDTNIMVGHIDERGVTYPISIPKRYQPDVKPLDRSRKE